MTMTLAQAKKKAEAEIKHSRIRQIRNNNEGINHILDSSMTLESLQDTVNSWVDRFGKDSVIVFDMEHDYSDSYPNFYIQQNYQESDDEYAERMKNLDAYVEKRALEIIKDYDKQTAQELKEFERLKKKLAKKGLA